MKNLSTLIILIYLSSCCSNKSKIPIVVSPPILPLPKEYVAQQKEQMMPKLQFVKIEFFVEFPNGEKHLYVNRHSQGLEHSKNCPECLKEKQNRK